MEHITITLAKYETRRSNKIYIAIGFAALATFTSFAAKGAQSEIFDMFGVTAEIR